EYILEEPLGRGGFGEVWRARHHLWSDREVAVKIPTSPEAVRELSNEGILQASLEHPGIARTLGMDTAASPPYFITEFVPGTNLRQVLMERTSLPPDEVFVLLDRILEILAYAHDQGVIHQDIKPENILVTPEGEVKLTDFGLGQNVHGESVLLSASLRSEGTQFAGTLAYIAPEVRDQQGQVDGRADLYSLGIVFFELLTGQRPAGAELPSDLKKDLPVWCDEVFKGLYTRRENRFASVEEVRAKLSSSQDAKNRKKGPRVIPLTPPNRRLLSKDEACRILELSKGELDHWIRRSKLVPVSVNGVLYLQAEEVFSLRSQHPVTGSANNGGCSTTKSTRSRYARPIGTPGGGSPVVATQPAPAGFLIRSLAMIIDLMVVVPLIFAPPFLFVWPFGLVTSLVLYFSLCTGLCGRTLGKLAVGIRVVRRDGRPLNAFDGFVRTILYLASMIPFGMGFLAISFSMEHLAFHDLLCGTRVVHDRN
ncbi:MAG: protein kinase, partial [Planctomycetota bacterium]